jgi:mannose-6-phosphate isomerase-like protein (cupin superfamily)
MITATDVMRRHTTSAVYLAGEIFEQATVQGLAAAAARVRDLQRSLAAAETSAYTTGRIVTTITDAITSRLLTLAEARLGVGCATTPHHHAVTEEIYYLLSGTAAMTLGDETRPVGPGDAIAIPPGARHTIRNTGDCELVFLCTCAPGYEHTDTFLDPPA